MIIIYIVLIIKTYYNNAIDEWVGVKHPVTNIAYISGWEYVDVLWTCIQPCFVQEKKAKLDF